MKDSKVNVILHPIRMRIIQTLIGGQRLTVQQINELLPEVPQATLYRHFNKLVEAEVLTVVEENPVRGTIEKVYSLNAQTMKHTNEQLEKAGREEHFNYFFTFLMNLLGDFETYLQKEKLDLKADKVGYRKASVYLTDEEFTKLWKTITTAIMEATQNKPEPGRKLMNLSTIVIPHVNPEDLK